MRLLVLSLLVSLLLSPAVMSAGAEYQMAGPGASHKKSSAKKKKARRYINITALHQSLPGSQLADETCLLFRVDNCDVVVLADDEQRVKFIYVRVMPGVKKNKRREVLNAVKGRLQMAYDRPNKLSELIAADGSAALLYYDLGGGAGGDALIAAPRCEVLQNIFSKFTDTEPELRSAEGFACSFVVETEGVEIEITVDLSLPIVNYVELRGGKVKSQWKVNPEDVVSGLFPDLDDKPERANAVFGKGAARLRTLSCDDAFYLVRNARFFAVGTEPQLNRAVASGAGIKKYGFEKADFRALEVTLPANSVADTLVAPSADELEPTPPDTPVDTPPEAEPHPATPTPADDALAVPPAQADTPLSPEAAREAYRKMLREM